MVLQIGFSVGFVLPLQIVGAPGVERGDVQQLFIASGEMGEARLLHHGQQGGVVGQKTVTHREPGHPLQSGNGRVEGFQAKLVEGLKVAKGTLLRAAGEIVEHNVGIDGDPRTRGEPLAS